MDREKLINEIACDIIRVSSKIELLSDADLEHYQGLTTTVKLSEYGNGVLLIVLRSLKLSERIYQDIEEVKSFNYKPQDYEKNTPHT